MTVRDLRRAGDDDDVLLESTASWLLPLSSRRSDDSSLFLPSTCEPSLEGSTLENLGFAVIFVVDGFGFGFGFVLFVSSEFEFAAYFIPAAKSDSHI